MNDVWGNMERYKFLSGNALKWIGVFTMFIDHAGAVLVSKILLLTGDLRWIDIYWLCRYIGRIAFPLFCFTLVEGFMHTRSRKRYFARMCLFALVSEVPFDLALTGKWFSLKDVSVIATFALGLLVLMALRWLLEPIRGKGVNAGSFFRALSAIAVIGAAMGVAEALYVDYGAVGILVIVLFYLFYDRRITAAVFGCGALLLLGKVQLPGLLAILPILAYNGKRGNQSKYFFYIFYPAHLLLFGLLAIYVLV